MLRELSDAELLEKLQANPAIRDRGGCLLLAVGDESGELREADFAELRIIEEMRQLGRESLTAWAQSQVEKAEEEIRCAEKVWREGKKNSGGTARLAR